VSFVPQSGLLQIWFDNPRAQQKGKNHAHGLDKKVLFSGEWTGAFLRNSVVA
jgi:hypothetical protein